MHSIRLRGPWQYTPIATTRWTADGQSQETGTTVPEPGKMKIPCDWSDTLGANFHGKVLFQRYFHQPAGLADGDVVRLSIEQVNALADVFLNHEAIGCVAAKSGSVAFDIEDKLEPRNLLEIIVDFPALDDQSDALTTITEVAGGITGEVQLEILAQDSHE